MARCWVWALILCQVSAAVGQEPPADDGEDAHPPEEEAEPAAPAPVVEAQPGLWDTYWLASGLALPYPLENVFRGFSNCRRGRHRHQALDIGGVGPDWGLGTPVRAMARARVIYIGTPETDPARYGARLTEPATTVRNRETLPTSAEIEGYGRVWFFTQSHGHARTGVYVSLQVLEGKLKGHALDYMHLAAVRPDLKVGDLVEGGEALGLMGGTAVQSDAPHLHLAIKTPSGRHLDVGPVLELGPTLAPCRAGKGGERSRRAAYTKKAWALMQRLRAARMERLVQPAAPATCGDWEVDATVDAAGALVWPVPGLLSGDGAWRVQARRLAGAWQPRLLVESEHGRPLYDGQRAAKGAGAWKPRAQETGRKGDEAALWLQPQGDQGVVVILRGWGGALPPGAQARLRVERPCPSPP
jgi:murein DD-endopeptidase MepM/ murein hydrolase activator NlpD